MLRIIANTGIVLGTAIVSIALIYFSIPTRNTSQKTFDVILVLGTPATSDGTISQIGQARVLEAVKQYRLGVAPRLLMTGGAAHNRFIESDVMAAFAQAQGVPLSAIYKEEQSRNTIQNAYYAFHVMLSHDWQSALVVSTPGHVRRASLVFRYYPIAWRMHSAPWPPEMGLRGRLDRWCREIVLGSVERIFGFPASERRYFPQVHFTPGPF